MSSNVMAWQNSFFMSQLPKHKTQYVKFQTSVSLYLYSERNIANWIVNPTWNIVYFHRQWGKTLRLGKTHSSRADCRNIKNNMPRFKHLYICIWTLMGILLIGASFQFGILYNFFTVWAPTKWLGKTHSSWTDCRNINPNMSSFKNLYLCICTLRGILLIGSSNQLEILYISVDYKVKH